MIGDLAGMLALLAGCGKKGPPLTPIVRVPAAGARPFYTDTAFGAAVLLTLLATILGSAGVLVERWLFFAEARHAVMNYYGG